MYFHIGAFVYQLRIVKSLTNELGKPLRGRAIHDTREILIDAAIHRSMRKSVLMHELTHCWEFHVPEPRDGEERARLNELIYTKFEADYTEQNGDEILENLRVDGEDLIDDSDRDILPASNSDIRSEPIRSVSSAVHPGLASHETASCPICDMRRSGGSIITSPPELNERHNGWIVIRTGYCDGCHILYRWEQLSSRGGVPLDNAVATEPEIIRGSEVDQWLEQHQVMVGSSDW
jgi:hypothetical protein